MAVHMAPQSPAIVPYRRLSSFSCCLTKNAKASSSPSLPGRPGRDSREGVGNKKVGLATKITPHNVIAEAIASRGPKGSFNTILPKIAVNVGPKKKITVASAKGMTLNA